jgi:hypothetical protein
MKQSQPNSSACLADSQWMQHALYHHTVPLHIVCVIPVLIHAPAVVDATGRIIKALDAYDCAEAQNIKAYYKKCGGMCRRTQPMHCSFPRPSTISAVATGAVVTTLLQTLRWQLHLLCTNDSAAAHLQPDFPGMHFAEQTLPSTLYFPAE